MNRKQRKEEVGCRYPIQPCSARVLLSVTVDNLFTREELDQRGIDEHDMVLECFENLFELVANGEDLTVEDIDVRWPGVQEENENERVS
jgi:hypothetical protein